jgi:hypothetical protein
MHKKIGPQSMVMEILQMAKRNYKTIPVQVVYKLDRSKKIRRLG